MSPAHRSLPCRMPWARLSSCAHLLAGQPLLPAGVPVVKGLEVVPSIVQGQAGVACGPWVVVLRQVHILEQALVVQLLLLHVLPVLQHVPVRACAVTLCWRSSASLCCTERGGKGGGEGEMCTAFWRDVYSMLCCLFLSPQRWPTGSQHCPRVLVITATMSPLQRVLQSLLTAGC